MDSSIVGDALLNMGEFLLGRVPYIIVGLMVFFLFFLGGRLAKRIVRIVSRRTRLDVPLADLLGRLAAAASAILGLLVAAVIVFPTFNPGDLLAGFGITSVAIGFAFKDILQNWVAGVFILWRRPFQVGDQIRTREYEGTVEQINVRSTILETYDGERVVVPNSDVYTNVVLVRTAYGRRRLRLTVGIGYPESIEEARATIERTLRETEGVLPDPAPWVYVTELAPSSVNFVVYFWTEPEQANVLKVSDRVATGIKLALDDAGIETPYPHTVVLLDDISAMRQGELDDDAHLARRKVSKARDARQEKRQR